MGTYRKEFACCGSVTETEAWEPECCPFCTDDAAPFRKDAERYRWLRDVASGGDWEHIGQTTDPTNTDARIDECMAAYKVVGAA